jgi:uncharacterized protein DUF4013
MKMNIKELFQDSLSYPIKDIDKLLTLGVLFFFDALVSLLPSITMALNQNIATKILYFISNIIGILIIFVAIGYSLSLVKDTINNSNEIPSLNIVKNVIDGIKVVIVSIMYLILPIVIILVISYLIGIYDFIIQNIINYFYFGSGILLNGSSYLLSSTYQNIIILTIISLVLLLIVSVILSIAIARLANTNSLKYALNIKGVLSDISKIGWMNYLSYYVVFILILVLILTVTTVISIIPFIGILMLFLLILPFIFLFSGRFLGMVYRKSEIAKIKDK